LVILIQPLQVTLPLLTLMPPLLLIQLLPITATTALLELMELHIQLLVPIMATITLLELMELQLPEDFQILELMEQPLPEICQIMEQPLPEL
jgi:hypothetical protein